MPVNKWTVTAAFLLGILLGCLMLWLYQGRGEML